MNRTDENPRGFVSIAQHAEAILTTYSSPIATESVEALIYMTVGSKRIQLLNALTSRTITKLKIGQNTSLSGVLLDVVLGEYGSGKSHIGYLLKHNALTCGSEMLIAHVQITGEATFSSMLAALLRSIRIAGVPSLLSQDIEISAYRQIFKWCGGDVAKMTEVVKKAAGNISPAAPIDFARAIAEIARPTPNVAVMQQFLQAWINESDPKPALECFEMVFRLFRTLNSDRCLLLVDEFEAIQSIEPQGRIQVLQAIQDLHDDFSGRKAGLPATHLIFFSTRDWWEKAGNILPSLMGVGQRVKKVFQIPDIEDLDVAALIYRYIGLYQIARQTGSTTHRAAVDRACEDVLLQSSGAMYHMRSIHAKVRNKVEELLDI